MKRIILILIFTFMCLSSVSAHTSYNKGDVVKFANANWIVIKDSNEDDDYVTALKDKLLTSDELSEYAAKEDSATMSYYYSDTCYYVGTYGHDTYSMDGCPEYMYYDQSKVKEFLENKYLLTLGSENLKEISGYKIRLLHSDEIISFLNQYINNGYLYYSSNAEEWLFKDTEGNILGDYWSDRHNSNKYIFWVGFEDESNEVLYSKAKYYSADRGGIRPVINLLKSSIVTEDIGNGSTDEDPNNNQNPINENEVNENETNSNENEIDSNKNETNTTGNNSSEVVKVPNTLIKASMIFIICGLSFVCLGANIYIIFLDKKKK